MFETRGIEPVPGSSPENEKATSSEGDETAATPHAEAQGSPEGEAETASEGVEAKEDPEGAAAQYYDTKDFASGTAVGEMPREDLKLLHSFGFNARKRNNLLYCEGDTIMYAVGNILVILKASTMEQTFLHGLGGGGIGCLTMHPSGKIFAVGEICERPNVFIYEYPSLRLVKVLRNGTEAGYATLKFSPDGAHLATVGSYPDFMITVWQWQKEHVVLRSKAFSQEIFDVSFSPYLSGILTTCGTGHIRFWKMATTFTGLKLQGEIGKFGKVEISDIAGFIEFPDGKVLSGTETGDMLIWTSGQIKCTVSREGKKPCHDGMIETIRLTKDDNIIVTSGMDGFVRYWDFSELDSAETEEGCDFIEVKPIKEVSIQGSQIKHIVYAEDHWLVQDQGGSLLKYSLQDRSTTKLLEFHSNSITAMATLPSSHHALTAGADGTVNLYDIRKRKVVIRSSFNTGATSMLVLGPKADPTGRTVIVGFEDGVVRVLLRCQDTWKLIGAFKPHTRSPSRAWPPLWTESSWPQSRKTRLCSFSRTPLTGALLPWALWSFLLPPFRSRGTARARCFLWGAPTGKSSKLRSQTPLKWTQALRSSSTSRAVRTTSSSRRRRRSLRKTRRERLKLTRSSRTRVTRKKMLG